MSEIKELLSEIISLSEDLYENADWWFCESHEPVSPEEISIYEHENNITLPDAFKECLKVSNGFMVDFGSTTGYFNLFSLKNTVCAADDGKNCAPEKQRCIGWTGGGWCLYYDTENGDFFIERERYKYELIKDFCGEILVPVKNYLEKQIRCSARKYELLEKQKDNPYREFYDTLVGYNQDGKCPAQLEPPASEKEISDFEKKYSIKLPEDYRNWLLLSNGGFFDGMQFYDLDMIAGHINGKNVVGMKPEEYEGEHYVYLAALTGCFDYLMGSIETGRPMVLTEDFEWEDGEYALDEYLDERIELYEERQNY
ncbi:MAG: SMI1/KNR4 family protein [Ruminococcus sp.]|nr:SMI1/KNR4 family protein [Ruminococcus sp.]